MIKLVEICVEIAQRDGSFFTISLVSIVLAAVGTFEREKKMQEIMFLILSGPKGPPVK